MNYERDNPAVSHSNTSRTTEFEVLTSNTTPVSRSNESQLNQLQRSKRTGSFIKLVTPAQHQDREVLKTIAPGHIQMKNKLHRKTAVTPMKLQTANLAHKKSQRKASVFKRTREKPTVLSAD